MFPKSPERVVNIKLACIVRMATFTRMRHQKKGVVTTVRLPYCLGLETKMMVWLKISMIVT